MVLLHNRCSSFCKYKLAASQSLSGSCKFHASTDHAGIVPGNRRAEICFFLGIYTPAFIVSFNSIPVFIYICCHCTVNICILDIAENFFKNYVEGYILFMQILYSIAAKVISVLWRPGFFRDSLFLCSLRFCFAEWTVSQAAFLRCGMEPKHRAYPLRLD